MDTLKLLESFQCQVWLSGFMWITWFDFAKLSCIVDFFCSCLIVEIEWLLIYSVIHKIEGEKSQLT